MCRRRSGGSLVPALRKGNLTQRAQRIATGTEPADLIWGAHAPSRAGDGAPAIANFCFGGEVFGEAPNTARAARALPGFGGNGEVNSMTAPPSCPFVIRCGRCVRSAIVAAYRSLQLWRLKSRRPGLCRTLAFQRTTIPATNAAQGSNPQVGQSKCSRYCAVTEYHGKPSAFIL